MRAEDKINKKHELQKVQQKTEIVGLWHNAKVSVIKICTKLMTVLIPCGIITLVFMSLFFAYYYWSNISSDLRIQKIESAFVFGFGVLTRFIKRSEKGQKGPGTGS